MNTHYRRHQTRDAIDDLTKDLDVVTSDLLWRRRAVTFRRPIVTLLYLVTSSLRGGDFELSTFRLTFRRPHAGVLTETRLPHLDVHA